MAWSIADDLQLALTAHTMTIDGTAPGQMTTQHPPWRNDDMDPTPCQATARCPPHGRSPCGAHPIPGHRAAPTPCQATAQCPPHARPPHGDLPMSGHCVAPAPCQATMQHTMLGHDTAPAQCQATVVASHRKTHTVACHCTAHSVTGPRAVHAPWQVTTRCMPSGYHCKEHTP